MILKKINKISMIIILMIWNLLMTDKLKMILIYYMETNNMKRILFNKINNINYKKVLKLKFLHQHRFNK